MRDEIHGVTLATDSEGEMRPGATYREVRFEGLRLQEVALRDVELLDGAFEECDLTATRLLGVTLRDTSFVRCRLQGVDLTGLRDDADLRSARGYAIDPRTNRVDGARVALPEAISFLASIGVVLDG